MNVELFFKALGLAFILEGIPYFLFAEKMPVVLQTLLDKSPSALRKFGLSALLLGLAIVYFAGGI